MYAPRGYLSSEIGDPEVVSSGDALHLFHLTLPNHDVVAHVVSSDGLAWKRLPPAIHTGAPGQWDDDMIWNLSVVERDGVYTMLYSALEQPDHVWRQRIGLAVSRDLIHWEKDPDNPVSEADPRWYETRTRGHVRPRWCDPKMFRVDDRYYAVVCARGKDGPFLRCGLVGLISSPDLRRWEAEPPLFAPYQYIDLEAPQVFRIGRFTYLTACMLEDRSQRYWVAEDFRGPYWTPRGNRLAPPGHLAARVCRWQGHDALFCWHYSQNDWPGVSNPEGRHIPAPLVLQQAPDGTLTYGSWPFWLNYRAGEGRSLAPGELRPLCGNPTASGEGDVLRVGQGMEVWALGDPVRDFLLEGDLTIESPDGGLAFALDDESTGYFVQFLSGEHRVRLVKWLPGQMRDGRPWFKWEVVQEVVFTLGAEGMHVRLLAVGGEVELSADGCVLLSEITRVRAEGRIGVFAVSGHVGLRNASLTPMREPQHT